MTTYLKRIKSSIAEHKISFDSVLDRISGTSATIGSQMTTIQNELKTKLTTDASSFITLLNSFRSDFESIETCKRDRDVKTNQVQFFERDVIEKKSTILKLQDEMKKEHHRMYECQFKLDDTESQLTECKSAEKIYNESITELVKLRSENAVCSKYNDVISLIKDKCDQSGSKSTVDQQMIMSLITTNAQLSSTIDKLSSTNEQLLKKISNLEQNEKILKRQLVDNE